MKELTAEQNTKIMKAFDQCKWAGDWIKSESEYFQEWLNANTAEDKPKENSQHPREVQNETNDIPD